MRGGGSRYIVRFSWRGLGLPLLVLAVGLALSAAGWRLSREWIAAEQRATQERRVEELHGLVVQRMSLYEQALHATAAFIRLTGTISIHDWAAFVDRLGIADNYPGIPALAYAPVVSRAEAEEFVEAARRDGLFWFRLWPETDQQTLVPNRLSAPLGPANMRALGYDMYQDPVRRAAMDAARDSGRTAITAKVTLRIDGERAAESAFIAYSPVYAKGATPQSVEERRAALQGFTLAPIRVPTLMSFVMGQAAPDAVVRIHDGADPEHDPLMHVSDGADAVVLWWRRDISFSNRTWAVSYGFRPAPERPQDRALPGVVLLLGGTASLLLAALVGNLVNARGAALEMAAEMTRALRDSEAKFKAMFDNSVQFQALLTPDGRLAAANPAALALMGGDEGAVEGVPYWEAGWLDVAAERERCRGALVAAAEGRWSRLEVVRHTADGEEMWVDVSFRPVMGEGGRVAWIVAEGRDLTERRRREEALNRAVGELTRSNQELERFAHVAAHDLQEPCRTIISYAQLLERRTGETLDSNAREFLDYLIGGAHRMRDLVADLLAYSRVRGKEAPFAEVDCAALVTDVLADLQRNVAEAGAQVEVGPLPKVSGDAAQLGQVFLNLIGNALKFRDPSRIAQVRVTAERDGAVWVFRVTDNGIGIAPEYHQRVFEIFQRLHGPDRYPGTGIGLAICRKVVERHGGHIWVDSQAGQGSRFTFTLPAV